MSYILVDGERYYLNDTTGEIVKDNVSQTVADQRTQQTPRSRAPTSRIYQDHRQIADISHSYNTQRSAGIRTAITPAASAEGSPTVPGNNPAPSAIGIFQKMLRIAVLVLIIGSMILIASYCIREQAQSQIRFHFPDMHTQLHLSVRDTGGIATQFQQFFGRLTEVLSHGGMNK